MKKVNQQHLLIRLRQQISYAQSTLEQLSDNVVRKKSSLLKLVSDHEEELGRLNDTKNTLRAKNKKVKQSQLKIEKLNDKIDAKNLEVLAIEEQLKKQTLRLTEMENDYTSFLNVHNEKVAALEDDTKQIEEKIQQKEMLENKKLSDEKAIDAMTETLATADMSAINANVTLSPTEINAKIRIDEDFKKKRLLMKYKLLLQLKQIKEDNKINYFKPYPWQLKFWEQTKTKKQLMIKAAVRVGKTDTVVIPAACWLTNTYPEYWSGYVFDYPICCYVLGQSHDQLKRVLQKKLLGEFDYVKGRFSGGWIPSKYISTNPKHLDWNGAIKGGIRSIRIKTKFGGYSALYFFSYEQGQGVLMGDSVDVVLIDEQIRDPAIYPQLINRTSTGARMTGGIILASMTPEYGRTPMIKQFQEELKPHQFLMSVTWWDAPHWTEKMIQENLEATPPHLRDLKAKGIEIMGSGAVYPIAESTIKERMTDVPSYFKWLGAIDFGIRTGALVVGVLNPDNQKITVIEALRTDDWGVNRIAEKMLSFGKNLKWAWPMDGYQIKEYSGCGIAQVEQLKNREVKMLGTHAHLTLTLEDGTEKKTTSVEAGIQYVYNLLNLDKLKIDPTLSAFWEEFRYYTREEGIIKHKRNEQNEKVGDHVMDAFRYLVISMKYAANLDFEEKPLTPRYLNPKRNCYNYVF
jgi:phage terminase large subunit-like protein